MTLLRHMLAGWAFVTALAVAFECANRAGAWLTGRAARRAARARRHTDWIDPDVMLSHLRQQASERVLRYRETARWN